MSRILEDELVQRIVRNFLDVHVLRLIQTEPMWGYKIIKRIKTLFGIKIRHGSLYPLLNSLEEQGLLESRQETKQGRVRRIYEITPKGSQLIEYYYESLRGQLQKLDIKREKT